MHRFQVRRATVEDLPHLRSLWQMEELPVETLEKRFTEFQVALNEQGELVGAVGLQIAEGQGRLHSEVIGWFDVADDLRAQMWPRLETLARNQGLTRLWTAFEAPFWKGLGFKKAAESTLALLPAAFAESRSQWLQLPLRSSAAGVDDIEKQIAVLRAVSQAETQQLMDKARVLKWVAMILFTAIFGAFAVWVVYYARLRSRLKKRPPKEW